MIRATFLAALAALVAAAGSAEACDGLEVRKAWVREAPPTARTLVAYMELHNAGDQSLSVTRMHATSGFDGSMLHGTEIVDGVSRMRHVDQLDLAPGESASLAPGGLHLMLFESKQPLREGDLVQLNIECAAGTPQRIDVPVRRSAP